MVACSCSWVVGVIVLSLVGCRSVRYLGFAGCWNFCDGTARIYPDKVVFTPLADGPLWKEPLATTGMHASDPHTELWFGWVLLRTYKHDGDGSQWGAKPSLHGIPIHYSLYRFLRPDLDSLDYAFDVVGSYHTIPLCL